ncbi:cholinesterase [Ixodes scapularis]
MGRRVFAFLGVPYGQSTAGRSRFAPALRALHWEKKLAVSLGPPCPQGALPAGFEPFEMEPSEDCLHLNVWTPHQPDKCKMTQCPLLPVLVLLYGRDLENGWNGAYDGSMLASMGDVVVVVPNFRLGVFGFLNAASSDAPGNVALLDQALAFHWIKENIASFGGNSSEVTLLGHGSGATSAGYHLLNQRDKELQWLLRRFIFHSGTPFRLTRDNTGRAGDNLRSLARRLACARPDAAELLSCLRNRSSSEITAAAAGMKQELGLQIGPLFGPSFNAYPLEGSEPWRLHQLLSRQVENRDILVGSVFSDGGQWIRSYEEAGGEDDGRRRRNLESLVQMCSSQLDQLQLPKQNRPYLLSLYELNNEVPERSPSSRLMQWQRLLADVFFVCPVLFWATELSRVGSKLRMFRFSDVPDQTGTFVDDLSLVLGGPLLTKSASRQEGDLSFRVLRTWVSFARDGDVKWPQFKAWAPVMLDILPSGFVIRNLSEVTTRCRRLYPVLYKWQSHQTQPRPQTPEDTALPRSSTEA